MHKCHEIKFKILKYKYVKKAVKKRKKLRRKCFQFLVQKPLGFIKKIFKFLAYYHGEKLNIFATSVDQCIL
jgi:hypothetical protein